ncbi:MAG: 2-hydroxyacyl-CoA dehydratase, partial [Promethearchaeota archaeon]
MIKITADQIIHDAIKNLKEITKDKLIMGFPQHGLIPEELIHAAGFFPLRLTLAGRREQEIGDEYLSPTTCPFGRSSIGFLSEDHELYSKIDYLLTGTFCNGIQNVGNYAEYFDLPVIPFITPHTSSKTAFKFYLSEIIKLKKELEHISGIKINFQDINKSIKLYNNARRILRQINSYRIENPSLIHGYELFYLLHELMLNGPEMMIEKLNRFKED